MNKTIKHPLYGPLTEEEANALLRVEYGERVKIEHRITLLKNLIAGEQ
ncbi:MAG: hypothetical protein PHP55_11240 [Methanoculleus sp.]|nr:hypothetical protein [Candidatus Methanomethylophilaceae archaeon]MDD3934424.1 hypothetical protein [Methanoculleus sp.]